MSGMNPGFAAYLANKKSGQAAAMGQNTPSMPMSAGFGRGKKHSKVVSKTKGKC